MMCGNVPIYEPMQWCKYVYIYIFTFQSSSKNVRTTVPMKDDVTTTDLKQQTTCLQRQYIKHIFHNVEAIEKYRRT